MGASAVNWHLPGLDAPPRESLHSPDLPPHGSPVRSGPTPFRAEVGTVSSGAGASGASTQSKTSTATFHSPRSRTQKKSYDPVSPNWMVRRMLVDSPRSNEQESTDDLATRSEPPAPRRSAARFEMPRPTPDRRWPRVLPALACGLTVAIGGHSETLVVDPSGPVVTLSAGDPQSLEGLTLRNGFDPRDRKAAIAILSGRRATRAPDAPRNGLAENTLLLAMADKGPVVRNRLPRLLGGGSIAGRDDAVRFDGFDDRV